MNCVKIPTTGGKSFSELIEMLDWAKTHCPSYITNDGSINSQGQLVYEFYFSNDADATAFGLKWIC